MTFGRYQLLRGIHFWVQYNLDVRGSMTNENDFVFIARPSAVRPSNASIASKRMNISSNIFDGLVAETSLHCALASGAMYNYIVIGPLCVCACVRVCGGRAVSEPYYSQRAQCLRLSERFFHSSFFEPHVPALQNLSGNPVLNIRGGKIWQISSDVSKDLGPKAKAKD